MVANGTEKRAFAETILASRALYRGDQPSSSVSLTLAPLAIGNSTRIEFGRLRENLGWYFLYGDFLANLAHDTPQAVFVDSADEIEFIYGVTVTPQNPLRRPRCSVRAAWLNELLFTRMSR